MHTYSENLNLHFSLEATNLEKTGKTIFNFFLEKNQ